MDGWRSVDASSGSVGCGAAFFFLMPPTEVTSEGHTPWDLKYDTAWRAASCRAAFLEGESVEREPKGVAWPSMVRRQVKLLPDL